MRRALLIGVQKYTRGYNPEICVAVGSDLLATRRLLAHLNITVSKELGADANQEVSATDIKAAIAEFIIDAVQDDDLIVYFTGHGRQFAGVTYLVPSDANPRLPDQPSYLVPVRFEPEINQSRARSITFIIDACRDGSPGESHVDPPTAGPIILISFQASRLGWLVRLMNVLRRASSPRYSQKCCRPCRRKFDSVTQSAGYRSDSMRCATLKGYPVKYST